MSAGTNIIRRTVYCEQVNGSPVRFGDWAQVITSLGTMVEPFTQISPRPAHRAYDPTDDMARVDDIVRVNDLGNLPNLMGMAGALVGGTLMPRVGR